MLEINLTEELLAINLKAFVAVAVQLMSRSRVKNPTAISFSRLFNSTSIDYVPHELLVFKHDIDPNVIFGIKIKNNMLSGIFFIMSFDENKFRASLKKDLSDRLKRVQKELWKEVNYSRRLGKC